MLEIDLNLNVHGTMLLAWPTCANHGLSYVVIPDDHFDGEVRKEQLNMEFCYQDPKSIHGEEDSDFDGNDDCCCS